jgi:hypothetical protein
MDPDRGESRGRNAAPGSGFPELGALEGRQDLKGGGSETDGRWSCTGRTARDGDARRSSRVSERPGAVSR